MQALGATPGGSTVVASGLGVQFDCGRPCHGRLQGACLPKKFMLFDGCVGCMSPAQAEVLSTLSISELQYSLLHDMAVVTPPVLVAHMCLYAHLGQAKDAC